MEQNSKTYNITKVERREMWKGSYGEFQSYALQLEGVEGWVELSQKPETPAPQAGGQIHGYYTATTKGDNTYLKFKKVTPGFENAPRSNQATSPNDLVSNSINDEKQDYIIEMLEELTNRRKKPDVVPTDISDEPIDLSEIPF